MGTPLGQISFRAEAVGPAGGGRLGAGAPGLPGQLGGVQLSERPLPPSLGDWIRRPGLRSLDPRMPTTRAEEVASAGICVYWGWPLPDR